MDLRLLDDHMDASMPILHGRARALHRAVQELLCGPDVGCSVASPGGGYFLWVSLPAGLDAEAVLQAAKRVKVGWGLGEVGVDIAVVLGWCWPAW